MLSVKTPEEVCEIIKTQFAPVSDRAETISYTEAAGRVLAEDICASEYVPAFDRSTVDGFAVHAKDTFGCSDSIPAILQNTQEILMGQAAGFTLEQKGFT